MVLQHLDTAPGGCSGVAFLLPGPVTMHPRVLAAMARPAMAHRGAEFTEVNRRLFDHLRTLMGTPEVAVLTGSGTAGMEAAVSNLVHWGDRAVGLDGGKFGARMAELVERYAGPSATRITSAWGQPVDLDALESALEEGATIVAYTHNETSTGVVNEGVGKLAHKHGALVLADTVTATGGIPSTLKDLDVDVAIAASQKCIGGPSGLAFVGLSPRAVEALDSPTLYFDLRRYLDKARSDQTPFTPAVGLHLGCLEALELVFEEGLEARFARVRAQADAVRAAAEASGFTLAAHEGARSDTVTSMRYPPGITDELRSRLHARGVTVGGAQGTWKGHVLRIGHMGSVSWDELRVGWDAIVHLLREAGHQATPLAA
jgi:aspartate aminotransferase-like enzyme